VTHQYLAKRANRQLALGAIHLDHAETIHVHLMISANGLEQKHRTRLAKYEFLQIQKDLETYLHRQFPEVCHKRVYNQAWSQSQKFSNREQAMKQRTKQPSKKDVLKATLKQVFSQVKTQEEAHQMLADHGITLTQRGKSFTAQQDQMKCRLKTLGMEEMYHDIGKSHEQEFEHFRQRHSGGRER